MDANTQPDPVSDDGLAYHDGVPYPDLHDDAYRAFYQPNGYRYINAIANSDANAVTVNRQNLLRVAKRR